MEITGQGIQVGPIDLSLFSLIVLLALLSATVFAYVRASQADQPTKIVVDLAVWVLVCSVVVGRLFYVLNPPPSVAGLYNRQWMLSHLTDLQIGPLAVWSGGIGSAGALLGGIVGAFIVLNRNKVDVWYWADLLTLPAMLGLAIAPLANYADQQMYGQPTALPWGIHVANPIPPYAAGTIFQPTPVYVSLWGFLCLGIIVWIEGKLHPQNGELLLITTVLYLPGLVLADLLRIDVNHFLLGLTGTQSFALVLIMAGTVLLYVKRRNRLSEPDSLSIKAVEAADR